MPGFCNDKKLGHVKVAIMLIWFASIACLGCDGVLALRIHVRENANISGKVVDASIIQDNNGTPVGNVNITFFYDAKDSTIRDKTFKKEFITDESGNFEFFTTIAPFGTRLGALVAQKEGFHSDTLFFRYKSSVEPIEFIINLHRK